MENLKRELYSEKQLEKSIKRLFILEKMLPLNEFTAMMESMQIRIINFADFIYKI